MTTVPVCPACNAPFVGHWQCQACHCYGHNIAARYDPAICRDCDKALARRGARRCTGCGKVGPVAEFRRRRCRACQLAYSRAYSVTHREQILAAADRYYQTHREQMLERNRARRHAQRDRYREHRRLTYRKNRERELAYARAYDRKHRDRIRAAQRRTWQARAERRRQRNAERLIAILRGER